MLRLPPNILRILSKLPSAPAKSQLRHVHALTSICSESPSAPSSLSSSPNSPPAFIPFPNLSQPTHPSRLDVRRATQQGLAGLQLAALRGTQLGGLVATAGPGRQLAADSAAPCPVAVIAESPPPTPRQTRLTARHALASNEPHCNHCRCVYNTGIRGCQGAGLLPGPALPPERRPGQSHTHTRLQTARRDPGPPRHRVGALSRVATLAPQTCHPQPQRLYSPSICMSLPPAPPGVIACSLACLLSGPGPYAQ